MGTAERVDVPFLIRAPATFLNVRAYEVCLHATGCRAVRGFVLATKVFPVLEPGTTLAGGIRRSVDVSDLHLVPPLWFVFAERRSSVAAAFCGPLQEHGYAVSFQNEIMENDKYATWPSNQYLCRSRPILPRACPQKAESDTCPAGACRLRYNG